MKEVIDLYAKLVISTFSFMGPSFTLLSSLFYNAIENSKRKHQSMLKNLQEITAATLLEDKKSYNSFKKLIERNKRELHFLDPKRQAKRLFISLIYAILFIEFYYFQNSHFWKYKTEFYRISAIIISVTCFTYSVYVLWQIFCTIIKAKSEEQENNKNLPVTSRLTKRQ